MAQAVHTRERLHQLVDQIPEGEISAAGRYLQYLRDFGDPFVKAFMEAPYDDEPTTPEEDEGVEEARQEYLRGEARPWEEVRKTLKVE